jgi:hypothetical protein
MSCLYSSPWIVVIALARNAARFYARRITVPFNSRSNVPTVAFNKDAFPNRRHLADWTKSFSLPKQAQVSRVSFQAQYQAFVRFAVGSSAAL